MLGFVLVIIGIVLVVMLVTTFGLNDEPTSCPTCGMGKLHRLYRGPIRGGPVFYQCDKCPGKFRQRFDGVLVPAQPTDSTT